MVKKILIVEDHNDSAQVMAVLLRRAGYPVAVAGSCKEALSVAAMEKPNVVLCDIGLPDGDGCDLLRELKQQYDVAGIAVSGNGYPEDQQRYLEAGFSEFVLKPCTIDALKNAIMRAGLFAPKYPGAK
jgi:CheY-like chemotaxis protein